MKTLKAFVLLLFVIPALASAQAGTTIHDDGDNNPEIPDYLEATIEEQHHFDRCTNYNNAGATFKKSCSNEHTSSPRYNSTSCETHRDGLIHCYAEAIVYCPGLGPSEAGGWLRFIGGKTANVNEQMPPLAAGQLGTSSGAPMRGVQVGNKTCGCIPPNGTSGSQFFGNPVHYGGGEYGCP